MRILSLEFQPEFNFFVTLDAWLIRPTRIMVKIFVRNDKDERSGHSFTIESIPDYAKLKSAICLGLNKEKARENLKPKVKKAINYLIVLLEK